MHGEDQLEFVREECDVGPRHEVLNNIIQRKDRFAMIFLHLAVPRMSEWNPSK